MKDAAAPDSGHQPRERGPKIDGGWLTNDEAALGGAALLFWIVTFLLALVDRAIN